MRDSQNKNRAGLREEPSPAGLLKGGRYTLLYIDRVTEPVAMALQGANSRIMHWKLRAFDRNMLHL